MSDLPEGYFRCQWCKGGVLYIKGPQGTRMWPSTCPHCGMHPHPSLVDETVGGKVDPDKVKGSRRNRSSALRMKPLSTKPIGEPVLGVDPGFRYTGVVLRDGDVVLYASTLVRAKDEDDPFEWAGLVCNTVREILFTQCPKNTKMAVEGVAAPKGFKNGERASLDPKFILFTGVVAGAVFREFKSEGIVVIPPGRNGSQHVTHYPPCLVNRRPKDLPGSSNNAGTRAHEQSAYDVAGKGHSILFPRENVLAALLAQ